jgi:hypothetical protein
MPSFKDVGRSRVVHHDVAKALLWRKVHLIAFPIDFYETRIATLKTVPSRAK